MFGVTDRTKVNVNNVGAAAAEGTLAPAILTEFADVTVGFKSYGLSSDPVTYEQLWAGEGMGAGDFSIDSKALAIASLLKAVMQQEEILMLLGQGAQSISYGSNSGLYFTIPGLVGATSLTPSCATPVQASGGTLVAGSTFYVVETVVTGMGESVALSGNAVTVVCPTAAGNTYTCVVTPAIPAGQVVLSCGIYASSSSTGPWYRVGYTNGAPLTITALPTSAGGISPASDASGSSLAFPGIMPQLFAAAAGTGGGSGGVDSAAQIVRVNGPLASLSPLNQCLANLWGSSSPGPNNNGPFGDPDTVWCNGVDIDSLSTLAVGSGSPYYMTYPSGAQPDVIANWRISRMVNKITSKIMPINVHSYLPQGIMLFLSEALPSWFIGNNVPSVFAMALTQDYLEIDYEPTAANPTWISEIRCYGAMACFLPAVNGIVCGISPPSSF